MVAKRCGYLTNDLGRSGHSPSHNLMVVLAGLLAALLVASRTLLMKLITPAVAPEFALLINHAVPCCLLLPFARPWIQRSDFPIQLVRAGADVALLLVGFLLLVHLPTVHVTLMINWGPLLLPFLIWLLYTKAILRKAAIALIIGWTGVALVSFPSVYGSTLVKLLGVAAALFGSLFLVAHRHLLTRQNSIQLAFHGHLLAVLLLILVAFWRWQQPSGREWAYLIGIGLLTLAIELLAILASRFSKERYPIHPLIYFAVLFSLGADWLVFGYLPTPLFVIGALLSIAGCVVIVKLCRCERSSTSRSHF